MSLPIAHTSGVSTENPSTILPDCRPATRHHGDNRPSSSDIRLVVFLLLAAAAAALAAERPAPGPENFEFVAPVPGELRANVLYQIQLTPHLLALCRNRYEDIRIYDRGGREIPFVLLDDRVPTEPLVTYPATTTSLMEISGKTIIDFQLPEKHLPVTEIDLAISNRDFKVEAELSGRGESPVWTILTKENLYDFSSQVNLRKTTLKFSPVEYRYFRLTITREEPSTEPESGLSLKYDGLDLNLSGSAETKMKILEITGRTGPAGNDSVKMDQRVFSAPASRTDERRRSIMELSANLPAEQIRLKVENPYYCRTVSVFGSPTGKEDSFQLRASDQLFAFPSRDGVEARDYLSLNARQDRCYRIEIENGDNPPLEVQAITLEWVRRNIFFVALVDDAHYSLYLGCAEASLPAYDLGRFVKPGDWFRQSFDRVAVGPVQANPGLVLLAPEERKAQTEKVALTIIIAALVIGLGYWLFTLIRKVTPDHPAAGE